MISLSGARFASVQVLEVLSELADSHRWPYISIPYEFEVRRWSGIRVGHTRSAYTTRTEYGVFHDSIYVSL